MGGAVGTHVESRPSKELELLIVYLGGTVPGYFGHVTRHFRVANRQQMNFRGGKVTGWKMSGWQKIRD